MRVELPATVFEHITDVVYESKLIYRTKQYGDQVRTFCMNPYGHVVAENVEGINTVNGHSYADPALRSENTNFALLVSNRFTKPFNEPYRYGKHVASLSNMLAGGVLVQRFGDLVGGRRTNEHRMSKSFVRPTLTAAVPGDLSLTLPKRQLDNIIEMIYALDKLAPGTANYDTLLYGAEVKFYSSRIQLSSENPQTAQLLCHWRWRRYHPWPGAGWRFRHQGGSGHCGTSGSGVTSYNRMTRPASNAGFVSPIERKERTIMIMLGTLINTGAIIAGGVVGSFFQRGLKERFQETLMSAMGLSVILLSLGGVCSEMLTLQNGQLETQGVMMMIVSLALGALVGEAINLEHAPPRPLGRFCGRRAATAATTNLWTPLLPPPSPSASAPWPSLAPSKMD